MWGIGGEEFVAAYLSLLPPLISEICLPYASLFDPPTSPYNGFTAYLQEQGLPTHGLWLPDLREHTARGALNASMGHQSGSHMRASAYPRLVVEAGSPEEHVAKALAIKQLPMDQVAPLSKPPFMRAVPC